jgi:hypothetical protein
MYTATFQAELTKWLAFEVVCLEYDEFDLAMWLIRLIRLIMIPLKLCGHVSINFKSQIGRISIVGLTGSGGSEYIKWRINGVDCQVVSCSTMFPCNHRCE